MFAWGKIERRFPFTKREKKTKHRKKERQKPKEM
jgi:hypothetical protein